MLSAVRTKRFLLIITILLLLVAVGLFWIVSLLHTVNVPSSHTVSVNVPSSHAVPMTVSTGPYKVTFKTDNPDIAHNKEFATIIEQAKAMFVAAFPKIAQRWNPGITSANVIFSFNLTDAAAVTSGDTVTVNAVYAFQNPGDIPGVLTHEWTHVVQAYGNDDVPGWFVEGMADYSRFTYGPKNDDWSLPSGVNGGDNYTSGYTVTARFLVWCEKHIDPHLVDQINALAQQNAYGQDAFLAVTGQTVDQLWSQYVAHPDL